MGKPTSLIINHIKTRLASCECARTHFVFFIIFVYDDVYNRTDIIYDMVIGMLYII